MQIENISLILPEGEFTVEVMSFTENDRVELYYIYRNWRELCDGWMQRIIISRQVI